MDEDKLLCSKCKRILTHFTEKVNEEDESGDRSDSDQDSSSDSDELVSSLYSSGSVVGSWSLTNSSRTTVPN